ncbi:MAG: hypothetical protein IPH32_05495 [Bacteroidetes bacterium]|nr:hypothetical protein [Bacteroidota bacterium]
MKKKGIKTSLGKKQLPKQIKASVQSPNKTIIKKPVVKPSKEGKVPAKKKASVKKVIKKSSSV